MTHEARRLSRATDLLRGLVLEDGRRWGEVVAPWQLADAGAILDEESPQRSHYLTRPRGGSKTTDVAGVCLAWLLEQAPPAGRGFVVASDEDQGLELLDAARGFVQRTPGLAGALTVEATRLHVPATDASVRVLPADASGNFGKRPLLTIVDEAGAWPDTAAARRNWVATVSAVPKGKGRGRLVVMTTAADPSHRGYRVLQHARATPARWRVSEVPGPLPWIDPADLAEQRALLTEWEYARLHENRWMAADDRLVDLGDLRECVVLDGPQRPRRGVRYSLGVDIGLKADRTVLAVVHAEHAPARRIVLDRMLVFAGSRERPVALADVETALLELWRTYARPAVLLDPWQAVGLAQRARAAGVRVEEFAFSTTSVGRLARTLHLLLRDRLIALPDDDELLDELANVRLRETAAGVLRMDHDPGRHDDRAIALALAALPLVQQASPARCSIHVPVGTIVTGARSAIGGRGTGRLGGVGVPAGGRVMTGARSATGGRRWST